MFSMFFMGTLYLEQVLGFDPLEIGLAFLPMSVVMGVFSVAVSARLTARFGAQSVLVPALVLIAAALALFARVPVDGSYWVDVLPAVLLLGVGAGLAFPSLMTLAMSGVDPADAGPRLRPGQHDRAGRRRARPRRPGDAVDEPHRGPAGGRRVDRGRADRRLPARVRRRRRPDRRRHRDRARDAAARPHQRPHRPEPQARDRRSLSMLKDTKAFSGFAAPDIEPLRAFYGDTLGIDVTEEYGMLTLHLEGGQAADADLPEARPRARELHDPQLRRRRHRRHGRRARRARRRVREVRRGLRPGRARHRARRGPADRLVQGPGGQHPVRAPGELRATRWRTAR